MERIKKNLLLLVGGLFLLALGVSNYSGSFTLVGVGLIMFPVYIYLEKILQTFELVGELMKGDIDVSEIIEKTKKKEEAK